MMVKDLVSDLEKGDRTEEMLMGQELSTVAFTDFEIFARALGRPRVLQSGLSGRLFQSGLGQMLGQQAQGMGNQNSIRQNALQNAMDYGESISIDPAEIFGRNR